MDIKIHSQKTKADFANWLSNSSEWINDYNSQKNQVNETIIQYRDSLNELNESHEIYQQSLKLFNGIKRDVAFETKYQDNKSKLVSSIEQERSAWISAGFEIDCDENSGNGYCFRVQTPGLIIEKKKHSYVTKGLSHIENLVTRAESYSE